MPLMLAICLSSIVAPMQGACSNLTVQDMVDAWLSTQGPSAEEAVLGATTADSLTVVSASLPQVGPVVYDVTEQICEEV